MKEKKFNYLAIIKPYQERQRVVPIMADTQEEALSYLFKRFDVINSEIFDLYRHEEIKNYVENDIKNEQKRKVGHGRK